MARKDIFNPRRHRLLRKHVSLGENLSVVVVAGALVGLVAWVAGQRDAYDPGMRDLAPELLTRDGPKIELYRQPLRPWVEPGQMIVGPGLPALAPFPDGVLADGWALSGRVKSFDTSNLYEKINGEAEKFIKQGFNALHYAVLRAPDGTELAIELFDQGGLSGSIGIFAEHKPAARTVEERAGVSYFLTPAGVIGRIGQYFFRAAADCGGEAVEAKSLGLVGALAALAAPVAAAAVPMPTEAAPAELDILRRSLGVGEAQITFEAANVFQFDFARDFWFAADGGKARAFVHRAASTAVAEALLEALLEEQGYDYETLASENGRTVMRHGFLGTVFSVEQRGPYLIGVENADDEASAAATHQRLAEGLPDER